MEIAAECEHHMEPVLVAPSQLTPGHTLYLSNLDDQCLLRFSVEFLFVFAGAVDVDALRTALSRVLVDYYPLAGRLGPGDDGKLVVDCNAEGALFGEGSLPGLTADEFLRGSVIAKPHESWRKLLRGAEARSFLAVPPLVVQVTHLGCGGTVLCAAISHCLCDGIGAAQFLHAWARVARFEAADHHVTPFHDRSVLRPRCPPRIAFEHQEYAMNSLPGDGDPVVTPSLFVGPLAPVSLTFTGAHVQRLKDRCAPWLEECTSFEALAAHVWRAWVRSLGPPPGPALRVKLLFTVDIRRRVKPGLPEGYYGNDFVLACAESTAGQLAAPSGEHHATRLVRVAKDYVRSTVDLLDLRRDGRPCLSASLVISTWTRMGLEDLDIGAGRPVHVGPLTSETYCLFLPVVDDPRGVTALVSVPEAAAERLEDDFLHGLELDDMHDVENDEQ
ncbi:fatty alcohol:caffeoyl-CoA acyltransferase-like [Triticum dicoccoides]|uniref:fatty alcohol:caffeoyl-CoA acyltransferase-like n=1 Tax=Triticum dicoccoides TaxID=85692 RepID=UPI00188EB274|nr:fatty alcohol:caffeoyl-CoA acyltransferase-like [Triticum dicoccoides]